MLDDLKLIHKRDAQDALGVAEKQWQQLTHDYNVKLPELTGITNIVLAGMGGSALPGVFLRSWPGTWVPFEIVRDYNVPDYVNKHSLFISSSYSGNTEETLTALHEAESRQARIVVLSAGGLARRAARSRRLAKRPASVLETRSSDQRQRGQAIGAGADGQIYSGLQRLETLSGRQQMENLHERKRQKHRLDQLLP